tara:strand:- start:207 stop:467 length:261 start_codon:yes stop_codon:yes gene_type:complete
MNNNKQIKYNLSSFLERLSNALYEEREGITEDTDEGEAIDDIIQEYKDFISHTKEPLLTSVKTYVGKHYLVADNERVTSFINACYT